MGNSNGLTLVGFVIGLLIPLCSASGHHTAAVLCWLLNRTLDGLDGSLARSRKISTAWGGYLDILCDFTVGVNPSLI